MPLQRSLVASTLLSILFLSGCQSDANNYQADVFTTSQLNTRQEAKTINIISVLPAKVVVDNTDNRNTAVTVGLIIGAVAGGVVGAALGSTSDGAIAGGVLVGGAVGALTGTSVNDKKYVEGVSLTYKDDTRIYTSVQMGYACQFSPGLAMVISTKSNETRIQPNNVCANSMSKE